MKYELKHSVELKSFFNSKAQLFFGYFSIQDNYKILGVFGFVPRTSDFVLTGRTLTKNPSEISKGSLYRWVSKYRETNFPTQY
jgi:hypothetical protein